MEASPPTPCTGPAAATPPPPVVASVIRVAEADADPAGVVAASPVVFRGSAAAAVVAAFAATSVATAWFTVSAVSPASLVMGYPAWRSAFFTHFTSFVHSPKQLEAPWESFPTAAFFVDGCDCGCRASFFLWHNFERCSVARQDKQWGRRPSTIT